jgi:hypothetical protein
MKIPTEKQNLLKKKKTNRNSGDEKYSNFANKGK